MSNGGKEKNNGISKEQYLKRVQGVLINDNVGAPEDFSTFKKDFEGSEKNRRQVYDYLKKKQPQAVPEDFSEFEAKFVGGKKKAESEPTSPTSEKPSQRSGRQLSDGLSDITGQEPQLPTDRDLFGQPQEEPQQLEGGAITAPEQPDEEKQIEQNTSRTINQFESISNELEKVEDSISGKSYAKALSPSSIDESEINQLKKQKEQLSEQLDRKREPVINRLQDLASKAVDEKSLDKLTQETAESELTEGEAVGKAPDPSKIRDKANELLEPYGIPGIRSAWYKDSKTARLLENEIKARVEHKLNEPEIEKKFNEKFKNEFGKSLEQFKKDSEVDATLDVANRAIEQAKVETEIANVKQELDKELEQQAESRIKEETSEIQQQVESVKQTFQQQKQQVQQQAQQIRERLQRGEISQEQAQQLTSQLEESYQEQAQSVQEKIDQANEQLLDTFNQVKSNLKDKYNEQLKDVQQLGQEKLKERLKDWEDDPNIDQPTKQQINKLYKQAAVDVYQKEEQERQAFKEALSEQWFGKSLQFAQSIGSTGGGAIKNIASMMDFDAMRTFGESMERYFNPPQDAEREWSDLLDPNEMATISGQFAGSTSPSFLAGGLTAALTGGLGAGAGATMAASGLVSGAMETMQIGGAEFEQGLTETKSFQEAQRRMNESIKGQIAISPLYALEGLPFVPSVAGKVGRKLMGGSKVARPSLAKRTVGASAGELGTEFAQELTQESFAESIRKGGKWYEGFQNILDADKAKQTFINVSPAAIMGGGPQVMSSAMSPEQQAGKFIKAQGQKESLKDFAPDQQKQHIINISDVHGTNRGKELVEGYYANGNIDKATKQDLEATIDRNEELNQEADEIGLEEGQKKVFKALNIKRQEAERKMEETDSKSVKKSYDRKVKEIQGQIDNLINEGQADFGTVRYADQNEMVFTLGELNRALDNDAVQDMVRKGEIGVTVQPYQDNDTFNKIDQKLKEIQPQETENIELDENEQKVLEDVKQDSEVNEARVGTRSEIIARKYGINKPERATAIAQKAFGEQTTGGQDATETGQVRQQGQETGQAQGQRMGDMQGQPQEQQAQVQEETQEAEVTLPEQAQNLINKPERTQQENDQLAEDLAGQENLIVREGQVGEETAFFAEPEPGSEFYKNAVEKLGTDENTSAYKMPDDFKVKDLSDTTFDDYKGSEQEQQAKDEGFDAVRVMEADGSTVLDVFNAEKLQKVSGGLPELRQETQAEPQQAQQQKEQQAEQAETQEAGEYQTVYTEGQYEVQEDNEGEIKVLKDGKEVSKKNNRRKKLIKDYLKQKDKRPAQEEQMDFEAMAESNELLDVAAALMEAQENDPQLSGTEQVIAEANPKVTPKSMKALGFANEAEYKENKAIRLNWVRENGVAIDELADSLGVAEEDIWQFFKKFPSGYKNETESQLRSRFGQLTGLDNVTNDDLREILYDRANPQQLEDTGLNEMLEIAEIEGLETWGDILDKMENDPEFFTAFPGSLSPEQLQNAKDYVRQQKGETTASETEGKREDEQQAEGVSQERREYEQTEEFKQKDQLAKDLGYEGLDQAVNSARKNLDKDVDRESITEEDIRQAAQESDSISEIQGQSEEQLVEEANEKLDQIEEGKSPAQLEVGGQKITQVINNLSEENRQKVLDKYRQKYDTYQEYVQQTEEEVEQAAREPQEQRPQPDDGRTYEQQLNAQRKATKGFFEGSAKMLQKAFPNFNIVVNKKKFDQRWKEIGKGEKPKAFFDKDTVYVDPESATQDTLYHEFAHPWLIALKNRENVLYQKGKRLVKDSKYFKEAKEKYPEKSEEEQVDEALAIGIGEVGAMQAEGKLRKSKFSNWASRFWDWVKKRLGITRNIDISQITLADFMQIAGDEMLSLGKVTELSELRLPETATLTLNKINKLKGKQQVAEEILGRTGETISWHYSRIGGETFSDFMQGVQDRTRPIWEVQEAIKKEGNKITDALNIHGLLDVSLGKQMHKIEQKHERLYGKDTGFLGSNSIDENAFFYKLSQEGLTQADLDFFMMVRHAKERNARVRERTYNNRMHELERLGKEIEKAKQEGNKQRIKYYQNRKNDILNNKNEQFNIVENGSGMTDSEAETFEAELRATGKWETLEKYANKFSELVNEAFINELESAEILSPERAQMLREGMAEDSEVQFKHYVPLNVGTFQTAKGGKASVGKGSNLVKNIKGTDKYSYEERVSPTNQMFTNYMDAVKSAEHNRIMQSLLEITRNYPNENVFEEVAPKYKIETDKYGNEKAVPIQTKDSSGNVLKEGENAVTVFENGKPIYISIKQPEIITALSDKKGIKNKALRGFVRTISTVNQFFRAVLTKYNLDFAVPNFMRDIQDALVNIGIEVDETKRKKIRRNIAKGVMPSANAIARYEMGYRDSGNSYIEALKEMKEAGGEIAWLHYESAEDVLKKYEKATNRFNKTKNLANLAKDVPKSIFNGIGLANQMIEMGTRLSVYKAMRDQGVSPQQSSIAAKNVTVNFNKEGTFNPIMSKAYLFVNSQIQGATRNVTALYKSKNARRMVMALMLANIFNRMLWDFFDEDDEIEPLKTTWEDKSEVWLFNPLDPKKPLTVPVSYNLRGWVMLSNMAYDVSKKQVYPEEAAKDVGVAMYEQFVPLQGGSVGSAISPFFIKPVTELADNVDFKGDPIRPEYPYTIPPRKKEQYYPSTPDVYVDASDWMAGLAKIQSRKNGVLETSPENLQYITEYFLGGAGKMVTNSLKTGQNAVQGNPLDWDSLPIMRRFVAEAGGEEWRYKNFVYRTRDEAQNKLISKNTRQSFEKYLKKLVEKGGIDKSTASKLRSQVKEGQMNLKGKEVKKEESDGGVNIGGSDFN